MTGQIPQQRLPRKFKNRQCTIAREGTYHFQQAVHAAVDDGWIIQQIVCNSATNMWMALATKMEELT